MDINLHASALARDLTEERERVNDSVSRAQAEVARLEEELEVAGRNLAELRSRSDDVVGALAAVLRLLGESPDSVSGADDGHDDVAQELHAEPPHPDSAVQAKEVRGAVREATVAVLLSHGGPMKQRDIWDALDSSGAPRPPNFKAFQVMCSRMLNDGQLTRPKFGVYDFPERVQAEGEPKVEGAALIGADAPDRAGGD